MALKDVKMYYYKLLDQYVEVKNDLVDFEAGLKDGYVTEDQVEAAKEDVENIKLNLDRLHYILFLFELPNRDKKKVLAKKKNEDLLEYYSRVRADEKSVIDENVSLMSQLRDELKKLKK